MKEKTSVTLSPDVLTGIDRLSGSKRSRSAFIDDVLRQYLKEQVKVERAARDIAIIHRYAKELNRDAEDGLEDQAPDEE
jgi:metal-responsive CopG/Arc/MetJ family transcriptional regulator